jgi:bis(5'-nucleosidyl)-tetraphosphatase
MIEESFGTVALRKKDDKWQVFLIKHKEAKHWGFPKGHKNLGENEKIAALRELKEETNLDLKEVVSNTPFIEHYKYQKDALLRSKKVTYFLIEAYGKEKLDPVEIEDGKWCFFDEASNLITFEQSKITLEKVAKYLAENE